MKINLKTVFRLLITALVLSMILLLSSCDISKSAFKSKSDSTSEETIESKTYRKGDTVHYEIPNVIYKDTTIYRVNRQGTTIRTVYNQEGQMTSVDCFSSAIEEIRNENRKTQDFIKEKQKEKTENFDSSFIIYIMTGLVIIVLFALFLMFLYINKNTESLKLMLKK